MKNNTNLTQPTFTVSERAVSSAQAKVVVEPLEQGFGHTLGNALRRVLLSSLPGAAITKIRIEGVDHQFSTIKGVTEDVLDLTLNLKEVRIKALTDGEGVLRLTAKGPGEVTAKDLVCEAGFEVVNPSQHLATLSQGGKLEMELSVESGTGYAQVSEQSGSIGEIKLDALFSPVVKVSYNVEATRVGRRTDFDKLVLDILTDGTITPLEAVKQSAQILATQFSQVVNPVVEVTEEVGEELSPEEAENLRLTVEELDLPTRIANALRKGGFETVGSLQGAPRTMIAKVKNLGEKSVDVIAEALAKKGVTLGE